MQTELTSGEAPGQMSSVGHVTRIGPMKNAHKILVGTLEREKPLRRVDGRIILKWILENKM
jgi:hypothetical protein